jgi:hypothetical protein
MFPVTLWSLRPVWGKFAVWQKSAKTQKTCENSDRLRVRRHSSSVAVFGLLFLPVNVLWPRYPRSSRKFFLTYVPAATNAVCNVWQGFGAQIIAGCAAAFSSRMTEHYARTTTNRATDEYGRVKRAGR